MLDYQTLSPDVCLWVVCVPEIYILLTVLTSSRLIKATLNNNRMVIRLYEQRQGR